MLAEGYNELAKLAAEKGMKVCLHHLYGNGIQTPAEIDKYMEITNDDVYLLFDQSPLIFRIAKRYAGGIRKIYSTCCSCSPKRRA